MMMMMKREIEMICTWKPEDSAITTALTAATTKTKLRDLEEEELSEEASQLVFNICIYIYIFFFFFFFFYLLTW